MLYVLNLDDNFKAFLKPNAVWADDDVGNRGLVADTDGPDELKKTGVEKAQQLNLMLGQIANYCNVIARHQIVNESTSLDSIWSMIREHFGFNVTGS